MSRDESQRKKRVWKTKYKSVRNWVCSSAFRFFVSLFSVSIYTIFCFLCIHSFGVMSVPTMDSFKTVLRFLTNQKSTIGYSFMALLTIGSERIFSMVSFQCPCNHDQNFAYGITFLLSPAIVLLALGLFISTPLWRLCTGCCLNPFKLCPRGNCLGCVTALTKILSTACIAPIMWLCVALLNGTFYECAVSGLDENVVVDLFCKNKTSACREELARVPCGKTRLSQDENKELLLMLRAQSQVSAVISFTFTEIEVHLWYTFKLPVCPLGHEPVIFRC